MALAVVMPIPKMYWREVSIRLLLGTSMLLILRFWMTRVRRAGGAVCRPRQGELKGCKWWWFRTAVVLQG